MESLEYRMLLEGMFDMKKIYTGDFSQLSLAVIARLLEGNNPYYSCLRKQFAMSKLTNFNYDGYGYTLDFEVDPKAKIIFPDASYDIISGLSGVNPHGEDICGFALFVKNGCLTQLDAYSLRTDNWLFEEIDLLYTETNEQGELVFCEKGVAESIEKLTSANYIENETGDIFKK